MGKDVHLNAAIPVILRDQTKLCDVSFHRNTQRIAWNLFHLVWNEKFTGILEVLYRPLNCTVASHHAYQHYCNSRSSMNRLTVALCGLMLAALPSTSVLADTMYTYTGNPFTLP
jgi:hypothetical protein